MKTIKDIDVTNKKVIVRVDYNVPIINGRILDNNRIVASLETINYLLSKNAKIILMSHLGKIKTKSDLEANSLKPVRDELSILLHKDIKFSSTLKGKELDDLVNNLNPGDILLLENTRYMDYPDKLESNCDIELSKYWASLGDVYILDAFASSHRRHASTVGIPSYLPHAVGFLVERELQELDEIKKENKTLLLGGAKVDDKLSLIEYLLPTSDKILLGGRMCATFIKCEGYLVGKTETNDALLDKCKELLKTNKIIFPIDVVTENGIKELDKITKEETIYDIGSETIEMYKRVLKNKVLILINGTMGMYENPLYENGTKELYEFLKQEKKKVVVCGGDGASSSKKYNFNPYYISTGGGASLNYLSGIELPALKIMED